jgi:hypothetical protein
MSFLPDFEDDIFISYAHIDNQPLTEGQKGWISHFHEALEIRLAQLLGAETKIWRDPELRRNDFLADQLIAHLPKIATLVSVISPRYINSEWCLREMKEFYKVAEQTGGIRIKEQARIFKVIKTPVPLEKQPPEIQGLLGYEFYQIEKPTGRAREFNLEIDPSARLSYWKILDDLAHDIHQLLERLRGGEDRPSKQAEATPGMTVYLAETTFDLREARDNIRRELQQRSHAVLPDKPLPLNADDFRTAVREYLQRSTLSIHLIGENYGFIPEAEDRSHVCLQNELAAERSHAPAFSRLIWMSPGLIGKEERQRQFIEYLRCDSNAQQGAELLETSLEDLKTIIEDQLRADKKMLPGSVLEDSPIRIYVICDQQDFESVAPLENYLYDQGYEVILPALEGDEAQVREDHKENLLLCDACIIYYGGATDLWLRAKLRDLQKIAGYGRSKPMLMKVVYITAPETEPKQRFRTHEALVIRNFGGFSPGSLVPLLAQIKEGQRGGRS